MWFRKGWVRSVKCMWISLETVEKKLHQFTGQPIYLQNYQILEPQKNTTGSFCCLENRYDFATLQIDKYLPKLWFKL